MVFSNFLNLFAIFLEFFITGLIGPHRNDFFYVLSFVGFPNQFWLVKKLRCCFLIFLIFLLLFQNVQLRVGKKLNGAFFCLFSLSWPFPTYFGLKKAMMVFSKFLNFFTFFLEFSMMVRVGTQQNDFSDFHYFSAFPNLFWP